MYSRTVGWMCWTLLWKGTSKVSKTEQKTQLCGLLRVIRNKIEHFQKLGQELKTIYNGSPEGVIYYYNNCFPKLLIYTYRALQEVRGQVWVLIEFLNFCIWISSNPVLPKNVVVCNKLVIWVPLNSSYQIMATGMKQKTALLTLARQCILKSLGCNRQ